MDGIVEYWCKNIIYVYFNILYPLECYKVYNNSMIFQLMFPTQRVVPSVVCHRPYKTPHSIIIIFQLLS